MERTREDFAKSSQLLADRLGMIAERHTRGMIETADTILSDAEEHEEHASLDVMIKIKVVVYADGKVHFAPKIDYQRKIQIKEDFAVAVFDPHPDLFDGEEAGEDENLDDVRAKARGEDGGEVMEPEIVDEAAALPPPAEPAQIEPLQIRFYRAVCADTGDHRTLLANELDEYFSLTGGFASLEPEQVAEVISDAAACEAFRRSVKEMLYPVEE